MELEYAKNPVWANAEQTLINVTARFVEIAEDLPFTANPNDCEAHGRDIYARALAGEFGEIAEFSPYIPSTEELAIQARAERDELLALSDWTQLPDARRAMGETKAEEWDSYRQSLRDITQQTGFPQNIVWPVKPT